MFELPPPPPDTVSGASAGPPPPEVIGTVPGAVFVGCFVPIFGLLIATVTDAAPVDLQSDRRGDAMRLSRSPQQSAGPTGD